MSKVKKLTVLTVVGTLLLSLVGGPVFATEFTQASQQEQELAEQAAEAGAILATAESGGNVITEEQRESAIRGAVQGVLQNESIETEHLQAAAQGATYGALTGVIFISTNESLETTVNSSLIEIAAEGAAAGSVNTTSTTVAETDVDVTKSAAEGAALGAVVGSHTLDLEGLQGDQREYMQMVRLNYTLSAAQSASQGAILGAQNNPQVSNELVRAAAQGAAYGALELNEQSFWSDLKREIKNAGKAISDWWERNGETAKELAGKALEAYCKQNADSDNAWIRALCMLGPIVLSSSTGSAQGTLQGASAQTSPLVAWSAAEGAADGAVESVIANPNATTEQVRASTLGGSFGAVIRADQEDLSPVAVDQLATKGATLGVEYAVINPTVPLTQISQVSQEATATLEPGQIDLSTSVPALTTAPDETNESTPTPEPAPTPTPEPAPTPTPEPAPTPTPEPAPTPTPEPAPTPTPEPANVSDPESNRNWLG